jgi:HEAT repeat protein
MARLVRDLDDDAFAVREQATVELARLGTGAEPALRKALAGRPSEEVRRRIDALLARLQTPETAEARRRWRRAVELLELVGSDEARAALKLLAGGTTQAPGVTVEAQASLERLGRRAAQAP